MIYNYNRLHKILQSVATINILLDYWSNFVKNKPTIYSIAEEAGVHPSTVSRFFSNKSLLNKKTQEKISGICKKYDYKPSYIASAIKRKKTKTIALLIGSLLEPAVWGFINSVESKLSEHDYSLYIYNTYGEIDKQIRIIENINGRLVDGVIVFGSMVSGCEKKDKILVDKILNKNIPLAFADRYEKGYKNQVAFANVDSQLGGKIAAEYLLQKNHKQIGIITGELKYSIFKERVDSFLDILGKKKIDLKFLLEVEFQNGYFQANKDIEKQIDIICNSGVTAIFTTTDTIAIYLIDLLRLNKIRIPEDISIIGYGNIPFSSLINPKLTTINNDLGKLGELTVANLINKITKDRFLKRHYVIQPEIIERQSVKRLENYPDSKGGE